MLAILQFIFRDLWHFAGTLVLLWLLCDTVRSICVGCAVGHGLKHRREGEE